MSWSLSSRGSPLGILEVNSGGMDSWELLLLVLLVELLTFTLLAKLRGTRPGKEGGWGRLPQPCLVTWSPHSSLLGTVGRHHWESWIPPGRTSRPAESVCPCAGSLTCWCWGSPGSLHPPGPLEAARRERSDPRQTVTAPDSSSMTPTCLR